jgi:hypothetical protein
MCWVKIYKTEIWCKQLVFRGSTYWVSAASKEEKGDLQKYLAKEEK